MFVELLSSIKEKAESDKATVEDLGTLETAISHEIQRLQQLKRVVHVDGSNMFTFLEDLLEIMQKERPLLFYGFGRVFEDYKNVAILRPSVSGDMIRGISFCGAIVEKEMLERNDWKEKNELICACMHRCKGYIYII